MFELRRFIKLAAAHWLENRKPYAWFFGVAMMLHAVLLLIIFSGERGFMALATNTQATMYYTGLFLLAPIFAGRYHQRLTQPGACLTYLMWPASIFEKWLLAFVWVAVLFPLLYTLIFYVINTPAMWAAQALAENALAKHSMEGDNLSTFYGPENYALFLPMRGDNAWRTTLNVGLSITSLQAFAMFMGLYCRRAPFIKTLVLLFVILLAVILLFVVFESRPDLFFNYWDASQPLSETQAILYPLLWFAIPALLWVASWRALKEREVAA